MPKKVSFAVVVHGETDAVLMVSRTGRREEAVTVPRSKAEFTPFTFIDRKRNMPVHVVTSTQGTLSLHTEDARLCGLIQ